MHDKIVTGRQIVYPQGDAFPLCFLCTFHLTPHESPCTSSVTAQLSETSKSHSTASLVLLRSFKRGARLLPPLPSEHYMGPRWNRWNRNPSNILIAIHRLSWNVLLDNRGELHKGRIRPWRRWFLTPLSATWCNCANEAGP